MAPTHHPGGRPVDCIDWWGTQRRPYNITLIISMLAGFLLQEISVSFASHAFPGHEITLFTIVLTLPFPAVGIALANVCYNLGPIAESLVRPRNIRLFRVLAYTAGTGFSMLLTMLPSLFTLRQALTAPLPPLP